MKNIKMLYIALIALIAGAFSSCTSDWEPGKQVEGAQVSFIADNITSVGFTGDPKEATQKLTLSRVDTRGELEIFIIADIERGNEKYFNIPDIVVFEAGEELAELEFTVDYEKFVENRTYSVNFIIADDLDNLTTPYGFSEWKVDFALNPWILMKDSKGNNAKGKFRGLPIMDKLFEDWFDFSLEIDTDVYKHKHEDKYMVKAPWSTIIYALFLSMGVSDVTVEAIEQSFTYTPIDVVFDCTDPNNVIIAKQNMGLKDIYGFWMEDVIIGDIIFEAKGGVLEDGVISFPKGSVTCSCDYFIANGIDFNNPICAGANQTGLLRLVLPGVDIADYSLAVQYNGMDVAADNTTATAKLDFFYGEHVTGIKYIIANGDIEDNPTEVIEKLFAGTDKSIMTIEDFEVGAGSASLKVALANGLYTVVAAPMDKNGALNRKNVFVKPFYFIGLGQTPDTSCQMTLKMCKVSELPQDVIESNPEILTYYPDYAAVAYTLEAEALKRAKYFLQTTEVVEYYLSNGYTYESLVEENGQVLDTGIIAGANSEGGWLGIFGGSVVGAFSPNTEYTMIVVGTNSYGNSATVTASATTSSAPEYKGTLALGEYKMVGTLTDEKTNETYTYDNIFNIKNIPGQDKIFYLQNLLIDDKNEWYAVHDTEKNTLTLSGMIRNLEHIDENMFGYTLGKITETDYYLIFAYPNIDNENEAYGPAIFTIDPATNQINGLDENSSLVLGITTDGQSYTVAKMFYQPDTTIVPYVAGEEPSNGENTGNGENVGENTEPSAPVSVMNVRVPFSSIKVNKALLSSLNQYPTFKASNVKLNVEKKSDFVRPTLVERYTPARRLKQSGIKF